MAETYDMETVDGSTPSGKMQRGPWELEVTKGKAKVPREAVEVFLEPGSGYKLTANGEKTYKAELKRLADIDLKVVEFVNEGQNPATGVTALTPTVDPDKEVK